MSLSGATRRVSWLGTLTASAVALAALAIPLTPAKAQAFFGFGPFAFGVGGPPITLIRLLIITTPSYSYYYGPRYYPNTYPGYHTGYDYPLYW